jgi:hypothetical protein
MTRYYQSDVTTLSDEEIRVLMDEIQATGILDGDEYSLADFMPEDSWERQASTRWSELCIEQHRRYDLAHSEEVERRKKLYGTGSIAAAMDEIVAKHMAEIALSFYESAVFNGGKSIQSPFTSEKVPRDS